MPDVVKKAGKNRDNARDKKRGNPETVALDRSAEHCQLTLKEAGGRSPSHRQSASQEQHSCHGHQANHAVTHLSENSSSEPLLDIACTKKEQRLSDRVIEHMQQGAKRTQASA